MKAFYFEGNEAWGRIEDEEKLKWLLEKYMNSCYGDRNEAIRILNSARRLDWKNVNMPQFGLYSEYTGDQTLGEWMKENGIDWPAIPAQTESKAG